MATTTLRDYLIVLLIILSYFVCSISLTFFNKWFFDEHTTFDSKHSFHYPLTVTCLHQIIIFLFIVAFDPPPPPNRSALMSVGFLCGMEWGLSNYSFKYISVSMYEMVKATTPLWVLIFSVLLGGTSFSCSLASIVLVITLGMILSVSGGAAMTPREVYSTPHGFTIGLTCLICATLCSGIRNVLAQKVLQHKTAGVSLLTTLYYVAPSSAAALVLPAAVLEGRDILQFFGFLGKSADIKGPYNNNTYIAPVSEDDVLTLLGYIMLSSFVALLLSFTEFLVLKRTSAITLCVAGISKQVIVVMMAVVFLQDGFHVLNGVGFSVTLVGIVMYNIYRHREKEEPKEIKEMIRDSSAD